MDLMTTARRCSYGDENGVEASRVYKLWPNATAIMGARVIEIQMQISLGSSPSGLTIFI